MTTKKLTEKEIKNKKMETQETKSLVVNSPIVPVLEPEQAKEIYAKYQALCMAVKGSGDFTKIGSKEHPNKQFANKLARMFGLSVEIVKAEKENGVVRNATTGGESAYFVWHIVARATAPNGQFRDGDGHCATNERNFAHYHHDVYAMAVTRAKNRAILELVGMGEVSEEEMTTAKSRATGQKIEEIDIPVIN